MIKLNITKSTFEKYLLSYGYNYKIKQYDDFILAIQRIAYNKVSEEVNEENVLKVFGKAPEISVLYKKENINYLNKDFFIEMIEEGLLDLFIIEKVEIFTKSIEQKAQYIFELSKHKNIIEVTETFNKLKETKDIKKIKAMRCLKLNKMNLKEEEILEVRKKLLRYFLVNSDIERYTGTIIFKEIYKELVSNKEEEVKSILDILVEKNFIFNETNDVKLIYPENIRKIYEENLNLDTLNEYGDSYQEKWNYFLIEKYKENELSVNELRDIFKLYFFDVKEKKMTLRLSKITKEDIENISIRIKNEENEIEISLRECLDKR